MLTGIGKQSGESVESVLKKTNKSTVGSICRKGRLPGMKEWMGDGWWEWWVDGTDGMEFLIIFFHLIESHLNLRLTHKAKLFIAHRPSSFGRFRSWFWTTFVLCRLILSFSHFACERRKMVVRVACFILTGNEKWGLISPMKFSVPCPFQVTSDELSPCLGGVRREAGGTCPPCPWPCPPPTAPGPICLSVTQHPVTVHLSAIDIGRYFFKLFHMSMWYSVTVPTLEFDYLCILYMNFLFSPVIVSFYFSSMAKLRFLKCCFRW